MSRSPTLIAGAGIAGLGLALALARRGFRSRVLERRAEPAEAGAGIQLGPNAMQVLGRLGVTERLRLCAGRPEAIVVSDGASGRRIGHLPLGDDIASRFGAPYWVAHRAELHAALVDAVREAPAIEIAFGFEVADWQQTDDAVCVTAADGRTAEGNILIGADGLWSAVRRKLFPAHPLTYAGKMAVRTLVPNPMDGSRFAVPVTGVWLTSHAHVVTYPVSGGRSIAVVAIVDEPTPREGWGGMVDKASVDGRLADFAPELQSFLGRASEWRAWSLYDPPPLQAWSKGNVGLIGDAAHPILPFFAQGGAMALEDAETLAGLIAARPDDPAQMLRQFHALRRKRVVRVQEASRANGVTFHLSGTRRAARDLALKTVPGSLLIRRYDWLYGWNGDPIAA